MAKISKMNMLIGLFIVLILIFLLSPSLLKNLYSSALGRMILIVFVLFFAMNNVTLGLFTALVVIIAANMGLSEGLENMDSTSIPVIPVRDAIKEKVQENQTNQNQVPPMQSGVDLETIKNSIKSQASASLPTTPPTSSEDVAPSSTEPFRSMYSTI
jgi:hypothetical protein